MNFRHLAKWAGRHRLEFALALRTTVACVASLAIAQALQLRLPLWAVLTAAFVTQASVGRSVKATIDYVIGTLVGVALGGAIAVLIPHSGEAALLAVLALAVAPLAFLAAIRPSFAVAEITAIIVLLVPTITHASAMVSAVDRVLEVGVGGFTGLVVSFLLLPTRVHGQAAAAAARTLDQLAGALQILIEGLAGGLDMESLHHIQDGIGQSLATLTVLAAEAERERSAAIAVVPQTSPLTRTLLRLRHDLIILGRAAMVPLPADLQARLQQPLEQIKHAACDYLRAVSAALAEHSKPPPRNAVEAAFAAFDAAVEGVRREGATRSLPADTVERFFAIGFAFDQMGRNLADLTRCVSEWAEFGSARRPASAST